MPWPPPSARAAISSSRFARAWKSLVLVLAAGLFALMGCANKPNLPDRPYQNVVIKVSCPGDPAGAVVERYGQAWAVQTGARVEVIRYVPYSGMRGTPMPGVPPLQTGDPPAADIWIIAAAEMPRWAAAGKLLPVPQTYTDPQGEYAWQKILPLYRERLLVWDRTVFALPLLGEARLCFYREDLLTDPRHRAAFQERYDKDLAAPATWEALVDIVEFFHGHKNPVAQASGLRGKGEDEGQPPFSGLPPLPDTDDALDREFYSVAAPFARRALSEDAPRPPPDELFSFHYDLATDQARIDAPAFVHALRLLQRLQADRRPGTTRQPPEAFRDGKALFCFADPAWISRFNDKASAVRGKFAFCVMPGSAQVFNYRTGEPQEVDGGNHVPYLGAGGWLAAVPREAANPEAAFALLAHLSGPKTSSEIVIEPAWGGGVFRREHLETSAGWDAFGLPSSRTIGLVESLRQTVTPRAINPVIRLRTPDEREHLQGLAAEVRAALLRPGTDAQRTLAKARERWRELDKRKDPQVRRREYRLSLGLAP